MELEAFLEFIREHNVEELDNILIEGDLEIGLNEQCADLSAILPYLATAQELQNFLYHINMVLSFVGRFNNFMNVGNG